MRAILATHSTDDAALIPAPAATSKGLLLNAMGSSRHSRERCDGLQNERARCSLFLHITLVTRRAGTKMWRSATCTKWTQSSSTTRRHRSKHARCCYWWEGKCSGGGLTECSVDKKPIFSMHFLPRTQTWHQRDRTLEHRILSTNSSRSYRRSLWHHRTFTREQKVMWRSTVQVSQPRRTMTHCNKETTTIAAFRQRNLRFSTATADLGRKMFMRARRLHRTSED